MAVHDDIRKVLVAAGTPLTFKDIAEKLKAAGHEHTDDSIRKSLRVHCVEQMSRTEPAEAYLFSAKGGMWTLGAAADASTLRTGREFLREPVDRTRFSYLLAVLWAVAEARASDIDGVRAIFNRVPGELAGLWGYTQENYAESFKLRQIGVPRDELFALVREALKVDTTRLGVQIRTAPDYATYLKSTVSAEVRLARCLEALGGRGRLAAEETNGVQIALKWPVPPHCVVLEGVPGTGKTYRLKKVRDAAADAGSRILGDGSGRFAVTLHPATAYEDFVEGLRPAKRDANKSSKAGAQGCQVGEFRKRDDKSEEKKFVLDDRTFFFSKPATAETSRGAFTLQDGFFVSICIEAGLNPTKEFVVLLDELNRCNIPKVLGDLLTTLESSKRARWCSKAKATARCWDAGVKDGFWDISEAQVVSLPYSQRLFFVPDNVYVIGTMNTTDRSVAPMDAALRRRFAFERVWPIGFEPPNKGSTKKVFEDVVKELRGKRDEAEWKLLGAMLGPTIDAWIALNTSLQKFGDDAMLGHSYLFDLVRDLGVSDDSAAQARIIEHHWNKHIFPQLVDSLLSNDLIDRVFPQEGTATRDSGDSLPALGLELTGDWKLLWSLRGAGLMRVPTITVEVMYEEFAKRLKTKTGNEAET